MFLPLIALLSVGPLHSSTFEDSIYYFAHDIEDVFRNQSPFNEEFFPYLTGGVDTIGFFNAQLNEEDQKSFFEFKETFTKYQSDPALLETLLEDVKELYFFPRLKFCQRLDAFEAALESLETRADQE